MKVLIGHLIRVRFDSPLTLEVRKKAKLDVFGENNFGVALPPHLLLDRLSCFVLSFRKFICDETIFHAVFNPQEKGPSFTGGMSFSNNICCFSSLLLMRKMGSKGRIRGSNRSNK